MDAPDEARIESSDAGAVVASEGWFVLNAADVSWTRHERSGQWTNFESDEHSFEDFGIGIHVLQPGEPNGKYHAEAVQEDFLVLSGGVHLPDRGRGAPAQGLGLRPLPGGDEAHLHRRRRWPVRDPDGGHTPARPPDPLPTR